MSAELNMENNAMLNEEALAPAFDESYDSDSGLDVGSALIGAGITAAIGGLTYVTKKFAVPKIKDKVAAHKAKKAEKKAAKEKAAEETKSEDQATEEQSANKKKK